MKTLPRVLLADDDEVALAGHQRILAAVAEVCTVSSGEAALAALGERGPFAVAIVEIGLPDMPGVGLLTELQKRAPGTVRVVVTSIDDLASAVEAFNGGGVFRYLLKPCKPVAFMAAVREALACHQQQRSEHEVRELVCDGIVQLLTGQLTSTEPELSAMSKQMKERARHLAHVLRLPFTAELEIAAELMRLGLAGVPKHVQDKLSAHERLAQAEADRLARIPEVAAHVVDHIPRLAGVAEILRHDGRSAAPGTPAPARSGLKRDDVPLAARILRALLDLQLLEESGLTTAAALLRLRQDGALYDRSVLKAMEALFSDPRVLAEGQLEQCMVETLVSGMVLATDAISTEGVSLVAAGTVLTPGLIEHLRNFAELGEIMQPVNVLRRSALESEPAAEPPAPTDAPPAAR